MGEALRCGSADAGSGPPGSFVAFGADGHASEGAETLRQIARETKRSALGQGQALPGPQEERLRG